MACCALAAFLFSQIIFALDWARERVGLAPALARAGNPTVAWRLDGAPQMVMAATRGERLLRRLSLASIGGSVAFVVLLGLVLQPEAAGGLRAIGLICTGHGLETIAQLRTP